MKPTIIVPIAGKGSRFPKEEWIVPKPLILIDDKSIIEWSMKCIDYSESNLIFIVRKEHVEEFSIDDFLINKFGKNIKVISIPELTGGSTETCLYAKSFIDPDAPLAIHCSDVFFEPKFTMHNFKCDFDGCILTFKSNSPNYSYSVVNEDGFVKEVVEKKVVSNHASAGIYWFKKASYFFDAADKMIKENRKTNGEFFIAPTYNILIENDKKIIISEVEKMHIFGTPEEYSFFIKNTLRSMNNKVAALCCDHSGLKAKNTFKSILDKKNIKYIDFGCFNEKDTDYWAYVACASKAVLDKKCDFGVGFCRSGQGVNIAANKIKGIRSAWVKDGWMSEMAIRHNCANFLSIAEKMNDEKSLEDILEGFISNTFDGGRHQTRLMKNEI